MMLKRLLNKVYRLIQLLLRREKMKAKNDDFAPLPTYKETTTANSHWVNVTLTKTDSEGNVTQVSTIVSKK
jgi:hypothetical protein